MIIFICFAFILLFVAIAILVKKLHNKEVENNKHLVKIEQKMDDIIVDKVAETLKKMGK